MTTKERMEKLREIYRQIFSLEDQASAILEGGEPLASSVAMDGGSEDRAEPSDDRPAIPKKKKVSPRKREVNAPAVTSARAVTSVNARHTSTRRITRRLNQSLMT